MSPRIRRGDESKGDGEERDVAGAYADDHPQNTDPARDQELGGRHVTGSVPVRSFILRTLSCWIVARNKDQYKSNAAW